MTSAVAEAPVALVQPRRRAWPALGAVFALLGGELAIFALAAQRRDVLRPVVYHGSLSSWQPTPLAHHLPALHAGRVTLTTSRRGRPSPGTRAWS